MSNSNRDDEPRHLGAYGVALALVLSISIAAGVSYSSGIESERRDKQPAEYAGYAKKQAQRACVGMDGVTLFECVYDEVESSQETARAEQDLDAQQGMKFWALWMFFATMTTAAITLLGVYYVRLTLNKNSDLLTESGKATMAMVKANQIAEAAQRPWLIAKIKPILTGKIQNSSTLFAHEVMLKFEATIENIGKSAASGLSMTFDLFPISPENKNQISTTEGRFDAPDAPTALPPAQSFEHVATVAFPASPIPGAGQDYKLLLIVKLVYEGGFTQESFILAQRIKYYDRVQTKNLDGFLIKSDNIHCAKHRYQIYT